MYLQDMTYRPLRTKTNFSFYEKTDFLEEC